MKYIVAVVPPDRLNEILAELDKREIRMVTVNPVMGYGQEKGEAEVYRGHKEVGRLLQKVKLEIAVNDADLDSVTSAITKPLHSRDTNFGEIFVMNLEQERVVGTPADA